MPTYEFICTECKRGFSVTMSMADRAKQKQQKCPRCDSARHVRRKITGFFALTSKKS